MRPPSGLDLSSNDYLRHATDPRVVAAMAAAVQREGAGSTGSRLLRGDRETFHAVESAFAAFVGAEASLYFSSGYLGNLAVLSTWPEAGDVVFSDAHNHASLIDAMRLSRAQRVIVPHNDPDALRAAIATTPCDGVAFVVVESVYSVDGDVAPLAAYAKACRDAGAVLLVDEAHAVGVYGARGTGACEEAGLHPSAVITMNPAGKALGVSGSFVAGPAWAIDDLMQRARPFIFSTAPPPAVADALLTSLDLVRTERWRRDTVRALARQMRAALVAEGIDVGTSDAHIVPVHIGDNARAVAVATRLQAEGVDVRAVRPPTVPEGRARLRVSVTVGLDDAAVVMAAAQIARAVRECAA